MMDPELKNALPEELSSREYILDLLGFDEFDVEKLSPVKKTSWPLKERRSKKNWDRDVKQAALRVLRGGVPLDEAEFREGKKMREAVETYLLNAAGYELKNP